MVDAIWWFNSEGNALSLLLIFLSWANNSLVLLVM